MRDARVVLHGVKRARAIGFRLLAIEIIDEDEIEIGGRRHLARTELAKAKDDRTAASDPPVLGREIALDEGQRRLDDARRQGRIVASRLRRADRTGEQLEADRKGLLLGEIAQRVEKLLKMLRAVEKPAGPRVEPALIDAGFEDAGVDRRVENMRMVDHHASEPRRAAENIGEELADARIGFQEREEFDRRRHARERGVETGERGVGIAGAGEGLHEARHELRQDLPRPRGAHRRPAAEMPAADRLRGGGRVLEAKPRQGFERLRIVLGAGEDEAAEFRVERRRGFEQQRIMVRDPPHVMHEEGLEIRFARKTAKA